MSHVTRLVVFGLLTGTVWAQPVTAGPVAPTAAGSAAPFAPSAAAPVTAAPGTPSAAPVAAPGSATAASARSEPSDPNLPPRRARPTAPRPATIEHDGQTFQLANTTATPNAETDEYVVAGETLADWTQLLTVQRLTLARAATPEEFLAYFQKRVAADGAAFDIVKQAPAATVFAVRFPKSDKNDEQVMICLAFVATDKPDRMDIVQYAIKPLRAPVAVVEMRLRSWKDTFVRQAAAAAACATAQ